jgi:hypothetical protein
LKKKKKIQKIQNEFDSFEESQVPGATVPATPNSTKKRKETAASTVAAPPSSARRRRRHHHHHHRRGKDDNDDGDNVVDDDIDNDIPEPPAWAILDDDAPALPMSEHFSAQIDLHEYELQSRNSAKLVAEAFAANGIAPPPLPELSLTSTPLLPPPPLPKELDDAIDHAAQQELLLAEMNLHFQEGDHIPAALPSTPRAKAEAVAATVDDVGSEDDNNNDDNDGDGGRDNEELVVDKDVAALLDASMSTKDQLAALTGRRQSMDVATRAMQLNAAQQHRMPSPSPAKKGSPVPVNYLDYVRRAKKTAETRRQSVAPGALPLALPLDDEPSVIAAVVAPPPPPMSPLKSGLAQNSPLRPAMLRRTLAVGGLQMTAIQSGAFGGHKLPQGANNNSVGNSAIGSPSSPTLRNQSRAAKLRELLSPRRTPKEAAAAAAAAGGEAERLSPTQQALDLASPSKVGANSSPLARPRRLSLMGRPSGRQSERLPAAISAARRPLVGKSKRTDTAMMLCQPREMSARAHMKHGGVAAVHELLVTQQVFCADVARLCAMRGEMLQTFVNEQRCLTAGELQRIFGHCDAIANVHVRLLGALEHACEPLTAWLEEYVDSCDPQQSVQFTPAALAQLDQIGASLRIAHVFETLANELERVHRIDGMSANLQQPTVAAAARASDAVARYVCFNAAARNGAGEFELKPGLGQHFQAILAAPTVRLMRLPLLLTEIERHTSPQHAEHAARAAVTRRMKEVGQRVNDASRIAEQERAAHAALDRFVARPGTPAHVDGGVALVEYWQTRRAQALHEHERLLRGDVAISEVRDPRLLDEFQCDMVLDGDASKSPVPARAFVFSERVVLAQPCDERGVVVPYARDIKHWLPTYVTEINVVFLRLRDCVCIALRELHRPDVDDTTLSGAQLDNAWRDVVTRANPDGSRRKLPWPTQTVEVAFPGNIAIGGLSAVGDQPRQAAAFTRVELHFPTSTVAGKCAQTIRQAMLSMLVRPGNNRRLATRNNATVLIKSAADSLEQLEVLAPAPHFAKAAETSVPVAATTATAAATTTAAAAPTGETEAQRTTRLALEALAKDPAFVAWQAAKAAAEAKSSSKRKRRTPRGEKPATATASTPAAGALQRMRDVFSSTPSRTHANEASAATPRAPTSRAPTPSPAPLRANSPARDSPATASRKRRAMTVVGGKENSGFAAAIDMGMTTPMCGSPVSK